MNQSGSAASIGPGLRSQGISPSAIRTRVRPGLSTAPPDHGPIRAQMIAMRSECARMAIKSPRFASLARRMRATVADGENRGRRHAALAEGRSPGTVGASPATDRRHRTATLTRPRARPTVGILRTVPCESRIDPRTRHQVVPMKVGVAKETAPGERRVALVPEALGKLTAAGLEVLVERGAGAGAPIPDAAYEEAGATIVSTADLYGQSDVVLRVQKPSESEVKRDARRARRSSACSSR